MNISGKVFVVLGQMEKNSAVLFSLDKLDGASFVRMREWEKITEFAHHQGVTDEVMSAEDFRDKYVAKVEKFFSRKFQHV